MLEALGAVRPCKLPSHTLEIFEGGPSKLEFWNDGHCVLVSKDENRSTFPTDPSLPEAKTVGLIFSLLGIGAEGWGESNVAQPSFLGKENSGNFSLEVAVDCSWAIAAKKSKEVGEICEGWNALAGEAEDTGDGWNKSVDKEDGASGNWNRSIDAAEETVSCTVGALKKSKLSELPGTDDPGKDDWSWRVPAACSNFETSSATPPELNDFWDIKLLSIDPKLPADLLLWIKKQLKWDD